MPVSEYGEVGRLVQLHSAGDMVILWAVYEVGETLHGTGRRTYRTSCGWIAGKADGSDYFAPKPRERSLRPAIQRAIDYAQKMYPELPAMTH